MAEAPPVESGSNKPSPGSDLPPEMDRHPFGGLEFQVSEVVGRLEACVNAQDGDEDEKPREQRKISAGFFEPDETAMDEILKVLEELVLKTDPSCESMDPPLLPTDAVTRAAILSHSIAALFGRLERSHAARLGAHIASETTRWMSHMFRLPDYNAYYHQEQLEGLVRVTRMLLHHRYPRYLEDGALAFTSRLPCIYSCVASPLGVVQHLCRQLGLPLACVRPVPVHASGRGMDIEALDRICTEDVTANRVPLLVLGEAGAPPLGTGDPLGPLSQLCQKRNLHLHLRGHALALPAVIGKGSEQSFSIADSLTLTPGPWFSVPGLPTVTFYKIPEPITANDTKGVNTSVPPGGNDVGPVDLVDAVSEASACVAFQFSPAAAAAGGADGATEATPPRGEEKPPPYYDKLNSWLGQVLQREADMINIEVCETEAHGVVLRYCPLEGAALPVERMQSFAASLAAQLAVLRATAALRDPFRAAVRARPLLRLVHVPGWAGLGGVRYVPAGWEAAAPDDLSALNRQLVDTLRLTDGAFSAGDGDDAVTCVRFGMVTEDTEVEELLDLVESAGREVEESSRALTNMTEVLKKGIEEAQADIERENAHRLWQEGLLRKVPVVGRVVQWWAPAPAHPPPPGRRLHLPVGTLQPTTDVYRLVQKKQEEGPETPPVAPAAAADN